MSPKENNKTYFYGVQWVDDGGPFNTYPDLLDLEEPFHKMNLSVESIIEDGGVQLKNGNVHWYIKTTKPIPFWSCTRQLVHNTPERYSSNTDLWLYTFDLDKTNLDRILSIEEWDKELEEW